MPVVYFCRREAMMERGRKEWRLQREEKRERRWQLSSMKTRNTIPQLRKSMDLMLR